MGNGREKKKAGGTPSGNFDGQVQPQMERMFKENIAIHAKYRLL
jgi:hypothetical protein